MDGVITKKSEGKLGGKDLINIGIYAAIYCVIMTAISMLGFIPVLMPSLAVLCPLIGGITMMLFYTKVKKFGMITIIFTNVPLMLALSEALSAASEVLLSAS